MLYAALDKSVCHMNKCKYDLVISHLSAHETMLRNKRNSILTIH